MNWQGLLKDGYDRIPRFVDHVLKGLKQEDLDWQPREDSNSIGWLVWHLTRQQDAQVAALMDDEQLWTIDKWYKKFKHDSDPKDIGFGHTPEQVAAFKSPDIQTLIDYLKAVVNRTKQYIETLSGDDLDRELNEPWFQPLPTVGVRIISILDDSMLHAGQAAYVRGLKYGKGWQKY